MKGNSFTFSPFSLRAQQVHTTQHLTNSPIGIEIRRHTIATLGDDVPTPDMEKHAGTLSRLVEFLEKRRDRISRQTFGLMFVRLISIDFFPYDNLKVL